MAGPGCAWRRLWTRANLVTAVGVVAAVALAGCQRSVDDRSSSTSIVPASARPDATTAAVPQAARPAVDLDRTAYIVVDLPARRRRASHHADWLEAAVAPGSIAKLATIGEALRRRAIDSTTTIQCTRQVALADGRHVDCSHDPVGHPLDSVEAIALSCNVFATTVARRLTRAQLSSALVALGLAPIAPDEDLLAASIGLGRGRVPATRLIDVLLRALAGPVQLREGLARAADRGTAAALARAGLSAYAKTGTARMPGGRSLGLAVAAVPRPEPTRAAVVLVPGGAGADAAEVAAVLLASHASGDRTTTPAQTARAVRLGTPRRDGQGYDVTAMELEAYVAQVVAGETTSAAPAAMRRALAIAARTFALANAGRHRAEGFDLCTLTHCQVMRRADALARAAALATTGRTLTSNGAAAGVFYSASCGGVIADAAMVGGAHLAAATLPWARPRPDPAGVEEPAWQTRLDAATLTATLRRAGLQGAVLRELRVQADAHGRVRRVHLVGLAPEEIAGDDFRRLVGHDLGWSVIKSSRYEVTRTATGYLLRGRGHGHGAGLCVFGASALAARGLSTDAILEAYFPGLVITPVSAAGAVATPLATPPATGAPRALPAALPATALILRLPAASERRRVPLQAAIVRHLATLTTAVGEPAPARLEVVVHPTSASYRRATRRGASTSAATLFEPGGPVVHTLPLETLEAGGRLESTLRHELVHVLIDGQLQTRPLWVREGLALHFAGERPTRADGAQADGAQAHGPCPTDAEVRGGGGAATSSSAYARAAACIERALAGGTPWREIGRAP